MLLSRGAGRVSDQLLLVDQGLLSLDDLLATFLEADIEARRIDLGLLSDGGVWHRVGGFSDRLVGCMVLVAGLRKVD